MRWHAVLFMHWPVPPEAVVTLLPERLELDLFDGSAWIGVVPFRMSGVRPRWLPELPRLSAFPELNVRTYVRAGGKPGVWFFSLDASSTPAVKVARRRWFLPYHRSAMKLKRNGSKVHYSSERQWPGRFGTSTRIEALAGDLIPALDQMYPPGQAVPGTLEHFLAERYILYSRDPQGQIYRGQVHHTPYPLREARLLNFEQTRVRSSSLRSSGAAARPA